MKIEIDDDVADLVVQESLVQTYIGLAKDLKLNAEKPGYIDSEDAEIYRKVIDAIEVLGHWYFVNSEFQKRVKKK
jgi:hypothetical protein